MRHKVVTKPRAAADRGGSGESESALLEWSKGVRSTMELRARGGVGGVRGRDERQKERCQDAEED